MRSENIEIEKILKRATQIIQRQEELSILKGENFNIFSILGMERKENETHSAFLSELLDPKGSHLMGSVFLELFLKQQNALHHLDFNSVSVRTEKPIGAKNLLSETGGRVDIILTDKGNKTICIENKIDAIDQEGQIARYCNYNTGKNQVLYLTLEGDDPDPISKLDKTSGKDFFNLSYKLDIIEWLEQCQKESYQFPILRETINQYLILIKKLTNQLSNDQMDKELREIIINNYNSAVVISSSVSKIELEVTELFLNDIKTKLKTDLGKGFCVEVSEDLKVNWSGIYITNVSWPDDVRVKLEGASTVPWSKSIYGIQVGKLDRVLLNKKFVQEDINLQSFRSSKAWAYYQDILDFRASDQRAVLFNEIERTALVDEVSAKLLELANSCYEVLTSFKK